jgi:hypothetical protein
MGPVTAHSRPSSPKTRPQTFPDAPTAFPPCLLKGGRGGE